VVLEAEEKGVLVEELVVGQLDLLLLPLEGVLGVVLPDGGHWVGDVGGVVLLLKLGSDGLGVQLVDLAAGAEEDFLQAGRLVPQVLPEVPHRFADVHQVDVLAVRQDEAVLVVSAAGVQVLHALQPYVGEGLHDSLVPLEVSRPQGLAHDVQHARGLALLSRLEGGGEVLEAQSVEGGLPLGGRGDPLANQTVKEDV
jgi:hypothetical protein